MQKILVQAWFIFEKFLDSFLRLIIPACFFVFISINFMLMGITIGIRETQRNPQLIYLDTESADYFSQTSNALADLFLYLLPALVIISATVAVILTVLKRPWKLAEKENMTYIE